MNGFYPETTESGRRYPENYQIRQHPVDIFSGDFDNFISIKANQTGRSSVPAHLLRKQENGILNQQQRRYYPEYFDLETWTKRNNNQESQPTVFWRQQTPDTHQQPPDIRGQFKSIADQSLQLFDDLREPYSLTLPAKNKVELSPPKPPTRNPQPYYPYRRPSSALADPFIFSKNNSDKNIDPLRQQNREQIPSIPTYLRSPFASQPDQINPDNIRRTHRTYSEPKNHQQQIHTLDILSTSLYDPNSDYYKSRNFDIQHINYNNNFYIKNNIKTQKEKKIEEEDETEEMNKTTPTWRNNFSQVRQRFGGLNDKSSLDDNERLPYAYEYSFASNGSSTMPRNKGLMKSASQSSVIDKRFESPKSSSSGRQDNFIEKNDQFRRKSETPEPKKGLENFWKETVRNRASSPIIQKNPFKIVTLAQERLEQLHEPIDDDSIQNDKNKNFYQNNNSKEQFKKISSDSIAQRRLNFLNGNNDTNYDKTKLFPSEKFISEKKLNENRSYSALEEAVADLKKNTEKLIDSRGCGKFPLEELMSPISNNRINVFTGNRMSPPRIIHSNRQHSPSPDSLSGESTASLANLPHPKPKHNIREQLMNVGASNTYLGPYMGRKSSTPNFPAPLSGSVASKISAFEKRPGTPTLQLAVGISNNSNTPEPPRSPLSPRTTIFKTKPVIHVDLGSEMKERTGAISPEYDNRRLETVSTSVDFHFPSKNNQAFIPRWRNDSINEAKPLQEQLISNNLPVTTTSTSTINLNLNQNQKSNINKSINVSKIIPTSKQSIFNDSINLTIEPKNLPPLITPFKTRIFNKLANSEGFYFPTGKPVSKIENDTVLQNVQKYFNGRQLLCQDFIEIAQLIGFPLYSKKPIFEACCQINSKIITDNTAIIFDEFRKYWERMTMHNHDEASRFVFTLTIAKSGLPERNYLKREDFHSMFYDLIQTYPGLQFLIEATQFHSRYVEVVTARIFWNVNKSWSNKITINELKESNLLQTMHLLEETDEINKITEYFSYEHFYVIYCKFWELDEDHDMIISKNDMKMHCNGALTNRIIDRIFSTAVTRIPRKNDSYPPKSGDLEFIGFEDFVAFLLAEEDKKHPKAIEYWFRCIDLDGDGIISFYEMELFYKEIAAKIQQKGYETLDFKDVASQLYDLVSPENEQIRLKDLKKCGLAHRFFNTFVNYLKYLEQESADGERASVKINGDKEMSDWDQFCAIEYEMLMSEADQNDDGNDEAYDLIVDDEDEMISGITNDIGVNGF